MNRWTAGLITVLLATPLVSASDAPNAGKELDKLQDACKKGQAGTCSRLADIHIFGNGVALRPQKARSFLSQVCSLDTEKPEACWSGAVGLACRRLADMYAHGEGVEKN